MKDRTALVVCSILSWTTLANADGPRTVRLQEGRYSIPRAEVLAFSPDSQQLAIATNRGVYLVQTETANLIGKHPFRAFSMVYSRDGSKVYLIGTRGRKLLDTQDGLEIKVELRRETGFVGLELERRNGKLLVKQLYSGGPAERDGGMNTGDELIGVAQGRSGLMKTVTGMTIRQAYALLKGSVGTYVRLEVIPSNEIDAKTYTLRRLARSQDNGHVVYVPFAGRRISDNLAWCIAGDNHELSSAANGEVVAAFRLNNLKNDVGIPALSRDCTKFAFQGEYINPSQDLIRQARREEKQAREKKGADSLGGSAAASVIRASQDRMASGGSRKIFGVEVYDIGQQRLETVFRTQQQPGGSIPFYDLVFTPSGKELVVGSWSRLDVYDVAAGKKVRELSVGDGTNHRSVVSFAVSSRVAAVGGVAGKVSLIDLQTGEVVREIQNRERAGIEVIAFSSDGKWLAYYVEGVLGLVDVSGQTRD